VYLDPCRAQHGQSNPQRTKLQGIELDPQVVDQDGKVCLYTQDTYRIGKTEGESLADVPWKFFNGQETRESMRSLK